MNAFGSPKNRPPVELRPTEQRRERRRPAERGLHDERAKEDAPRGRDRAQGPPSTSDRHQGQRAERGGRDEERDRGHVGQ